MSGYMDLPQTTLHVPEDIQQQKVSQRIFGPQRVPVKLLKSTKILSTIIFITRS